uniref:Sperm associated antigen 1 n=1 Tax=Salarias fasciatus TaxID=181472 RepID=A0A672H4Q8_SALFA
ASFNDSLWITFCIFPAEHLDYGYIETCRDVKYLEKILSVLRSGKEGIYPHLVQFCENHLEKLNPGSRALRQSVPVATASSLSEDEWMQISDDLKIWQEETKKNENFLKNSSLIDDGLIENLPPVRGSNCFVSLNKKRPSKPPVPRDYREWDRRKWTSHVMNCLLWSLQIVLSLHEHVLNMYDLSALSQQEKLRLSNREKDKGNEAFRARDYEEAVSYYSRSLSIIPTVAAYNNRAQAQINLQHWPGAMRDCQSVLQLEPGNIKALLRRATAHNQMGNWQMAAEDLRTVLREEPHNTTATVGNRRTPVGMSNMWPTGQNRTTTGMSLGQQHHIHFSSDHSQNNFIWSD